MNCILFQTQLDDIQLTRNEDESELTFYYKKITHAKMAKQVVSLHGCILLDCCVAERSEMCPFRTEASALIMLLSLEG